VLQLAMHTAPFKGPHRLSSKRDHMTHVEISPGEPGRLIVKFKYDETLVAAIKQIPGRQWNTQGKYWIVPDNPEARSKLTELFTARSDQEVQWLEVAPKSDGSQVSRPRQPPVLRHAVVIRAVRTNRE